MDIKDFDGIYKFKLLIPACVIGSIIFSIYQSIYKPMDSPKPSNLVFIILGICFFKSAVFCVSVFKGYRSLKNILKAEEERKVGVDDQKIALDVNNQVQYAFVIPNYKEDMIVLENTLDHLANHSRAQNYYIFLAMEQAEKGSQEKAAKLIQKYNSNFRCVHATYHVLKENELAGKAPNVSSCVQSLDKYFSEKNINSSEIFFTIMDADSLIPGLYIDEIDRKIKKEYDDRYDTYFVPSQIFGYNDQQASFLVRIMDNFHSLGQISLLFNCYGICLPLSNYTLSYNMIKRIGYWDTCADAIGEDYHTLVKSIIKTNGKIILKQIHTPINQMNIITGDGLISDVKARFWQGVRHIEGVATYAYLLNMMKKVKWNAKMIKLVLLLSQVVVSGFFIPYMITYVFYEAGLKITSFGVFDVTLQVALLAYNIVGELSYLLYGLYKKLALQKLYKKQCSLFWTMFQMRAGLVPITYIFLLPMFLLGPLRTIMKHRSYVRAEKKINSATQQ